MSCCSIIVERMFSFPFSLPSYPFTDQRRCKFNERSVLQHDSSGIFILFPTSLLFYFHILHDDPNNAGVYTNICSGVKFLSLLSSFLLHNPDYKRGASGRADKCKRDDIN